MAVLLDLLCSIRDVCYSGLVGYVRIVQLLEVGTSMV